MRCNHRRLKKNYLFGRKSKPDMYCQNCGEVVKPYDRVQGRKRK